MPNSYPSYLPMIQWRAWFICIIVVLCFSQSVNAQKPTYNMLKDEVIDLGVVADGNDDFSEFSELKSVFKDVEIVMLGEQSHGEATTYETKIKLIKYLHQELGFDLLVFESGLYDCQKAWELIKQGEDVKKAFGNSIFSLWSAVKDFAPLTEYVVENLNTDHELQVLGFDYQFTGAVSKEHFIPDLSDFISEVNPNLMQSEEWQHFAKNMTHLLALDQEALSSHTPESDTTFIHYLISEIEKSNSAPHPGYWIQILNSVKGYLSDLILKTDFRDKQMANNLIWLKEQHPGRKIICWGATSHFLYNSMEVRMRSPIIALLGGNYYKTQPMMGHYIKEKYGSKVYTVGFTAYQGRYGLLHPKRIKRPRKRTLEGLLGQSEHDNLFLPLKDNLNLEGIQSRPLGNFYMKTDIDKVMDAVVFNRDMKIPTLDRNFFLTIYPNNKFIQPESVEEPANDL